MSLKIRYYKIYSIVVFIVVVSMITQCQSTNNFLDSNNDIPHRQKPLSAILRGARTRFRAPNEVTDTPVINHRVSKLAEAEAKIKSLRLLSKYTVNTLTIIQKDLDQSHAELADMKRLLKKKDHQIALQEQEDKKMNMEMQRLNSLLRQKDIKLSSQERLQKIIEAGIYRLCDEMDAEKMQSEINTKVVTFSPQPV